MTSNVSFSDIGIVGIETVGSASMEWQKTTCPRCSSQRHKSWEKCLNVNVSKGVWRCHHCGWFGRLRRNETFKPPPIKVSLSPPSEDIYSYFQKRGIDKTVILRNRVSLSDYIFGGTRKPAICFLYYLDGELVNIKYRSLDKDFSQVKDGYPCFYKIDDAHSFKEIILTEGEIDALSFEQAGHINALSVPSGAISEGSKPSDQKFSFIDNSIHKLSHVEKFYLAMDDDTSGMAMRKELARRLGKHRCFIIHYPPGCKDANDVLKTLGPAKLKECVSNAKPYPLEGIHSAMSKFVELSELYQSGFEKGACAGFKRFDEHFQFYEGQLTVVTGVPSHGKSSFVDNLAVNLSRDNNWKWGMFSPENAYIELHIIRLIEQFIGKQFLPYGGGQMLFSDFESAIAFVDENFYFIQPENEEYSLDNIMEAAKQLVLSKGIRGLVIDPWNTIEHQIPPNWSETQYIGKVLNKIKYFSRQYGLHTIIIAHPRKMTRKKDSKIYETPTLYDISGSANWYNITDNGIVVYRQKDKDMADKFTQVQLQKVKHKYWGKEGYINFEFSPETQRFTEQYYFAADNIDGFEPSYSNYYDAEKEDDVF